MKMRVTQDNPNLFTFESEHVLEPYLISAKYFDLLDKQYEIVGSPIQIQATDPEYPFAYSVEAKPVDKQ